MQREHVLPLSQRFFLKFFFPKESASREEKFKEKKKQKKHSLKQFIPVMVFITLSVEVVRLFTSG